MSLIYIQLPKPDPIKIVRDELIKEEHFEEVAKMTSFRAEQLRKLLSKMIIASFDAEVNAIIIQ